MPPSDPAEAFARQLTLSGYHGAPTPATLLVTKTAELLRGARGRCPDCGVEQDFEVSSSRVPQSVPCAHCHRGLTLSIGQAVA